MRMSQNHAAADSAVPDTQIMMFLGLGSDCCNDDTERKRRSLVFLSGLLPDEYVDIKI